MTTGLVNISPGSVESISGNKLSINLKRKLVVDHSAPLITYRVDKAQHAYPSTCRLGPVAKLMHNADTAVRLRGIMIKMNPEE